MYDRGDTDPATAAALWGAALEGIKYQSQPVVDPCASDLEFIQRYGLKIDKVSYDFSVETGYPHMLEVFADEHPSQVLMAGAQTSKTSRLIPRFTRAGVMRPGSFMAYYFPDQPLAAKFSEQRFVPFIRSSPDLGRFLGRGAILDEKGTNQVFTRTIGGSVFFFLSVSSRSGTEGMPMQGIFFDEMRLMMHGDVARAEQRIKAQASPIVMKVSTAGYPNADIHAAFLAGDQHYWHSDCSCADGVVLSLTYPNCIADLTGTTLEFRRKVEHAYRNQPHWLNMLPDKIAQFGEATYFCPKCGDILVNPRQGWWEAHAPANWIRSRQMSQLTSPAVSAAQVLTESRDPTKLIADIYKDVVGLPFLDVESMPVSTADLLSCVTSSARWATRQSDAWRRKYMKNCALGLDAMGGYNVVVIKQVTPSGKYRTVHLEIIHGTDPWKGTARLMVMFDVQVAVIDGEPHYNEAHRFAKQFEGRVWLKTYTANEAPLIDWKDRRKAPAGQRHAGEDIQFKFRVHIHRTHGLQWSLGRWKKHLNEVPDPKGLVQDLPKQNGKVILTPGFNVGKMTPTAICQEVYFHHQQCVAFRREYKDPDDAKPEHQRGGYRMVADHVGLDPHFSHAELYANIACARLGMPPE